MKSDGSNARDPYAPETPEALLAALDGASNDPLTTETRREMILRIGRNVILFNQIESALKKVIPYGHPDGSAAGDDGFRALSETLGREPLGMVAERLAQTLACDDPIRFKRYLKSVVDSRNRLIHHFFDLPGVTLTEAGARAAINWLDNQHSNSMPLYELSKRLAVGLLYSLDKVAQLNGEELVMPEWHDETP